VAKRTVNPVVLDSDDVSITKSFVTLKVVQVNGRQMTQSVFKQLPRIPLFEYDTLALSGVIWGWVNYNLHCSAHKNFLIQKGQYLYTSEFWVADYEDVYKECINLPCNRQYGPQVSQELRNFIRKRGNFQYYAEMWDDLMAELRLIEQLFIAA
jgi:hypothetical protein